MSPTRIRLVGLGSYHGGDDQVGLVAANRLRALLPPPIEISSDTAGGVRLVDFGEDVRTLILLDALAATSNWPVGAPARWRYPDDRDDIEAASFRCCHSVSVMEGLKLAATLGRLPRLVIIHTLAVKNFEPGAPLSLELEQPLQRWIQLIRDDALQQLSSL